MIKEKFSTLWAYIESLENTINDQIKKIEQLNPDNEDKLINLAYQLHNIYSVYEDMFKEISIIFENDIDRNTDYHKYLLKRMTLSIPNIRPNFLSEKSYSILGEMLGFRYVFRHAYNYSLSQEKIKILKKKFTDNFHYIKRDIEIFKNFLEENFR